MQPSSQSAAISHTLSQLASKLGAICIVDGGKERGWYLHIIPVVCGCTAGGRGGRRREVGRRKTVGVNSTATTTTTTTITTPFLLLPFSSVNN